jgi:hypothetical protein
MLVLVGVGTIRFFMEAGAGITVGAGIMVGLETDFIMEETHHLVRAEEVVTLPYIIEI